MLRAAEDRASAAREDVGQGLDRNACESAAWPGVARYFCRFAYPGREWPVALRSDWPGWSPTLKVQPPAPHTQRLLNLLTL